MSFIKNPSNELDAEFRPEEDGEYMEDLDDEYYYGEVNDIIGDENNNQNSIKAEKVCEVDPISINVDKINFEKSALSGIYNPLLQDDNSVSKVVENSKGGSLNEAADGCVESGDDSLNQLPNNNNPEREENGSNSDQDVEVDCNDDTNSIQDSFKKKEVQNTGDGLRTTLNDDDDSSTSDPFKLRRLCPGSIIVRQNWPWTEYFSLSANHTFYKKETDNSLYLRPPIDSGFQKELLLHAPTDEEIRHEEAVKKKEEEDRRCGWAWILGQVSIYNNQRKEPGSSVEPKKAVLYDCKEELCRRRTHGDTSYMSFTEELRATSLSWRLSIQDDDDYENDDDDDVVVRRGNSFQRRKDTANGNKQQHHQNYNINNSSNQSDGEVHEDTDLVFLSTRQVEALGGNNRKEYMEVRDDEDLSVSDEYDDIAEERGQPHQQQQQRYHDIDEEDEEEEEEEDNKDITGTTGITRRMDAHPLIFYDHFKLLEQDPLTDLFTVFATTYYPTNNTTDSYTSSGDSNNNKNRNSHPLLNECKSLIRRLKKLQELSTKDVTMSEKGYGYGYDSQDSSRWEKEWRRAEFRRLKAVRKARKLFSPYNVADPIPVFGDSHFKSVEERRQKADDDVIQEIRTRYVLSRLQRTARAKAAVAAECKRKSEAVKTQLESVVSEAAKIGEATAWWSWSSWLQHEINSSYIINASIQLQSKIPRSRTPRELPLYPGVAGYMCFPQAMQSLEGSKTLSQSSLIHIKTDTPNNNISNNNNNHGNINNSHYRDNSASRDTLEPSKTSSTAALPWDVFVHNPNESDIRSGIDEVNDDGEDRSSQSNSFMFETDIAQVKSEYGRPAQIYLCRASDEMQVGVPFDILCRKAVENTKQDNWKNITNKKRKDGSSAANVSIMRDLLEEAKSTEPTLKLNKNRGIFAPTLPPFPSSHTELYLDQNGGPVFYSKIHNLYSWKPFASIEGINFPLLELASSSDKSHQLDKDLLPSSSSSSSSSSCQSPSPSPSPSISYKDIMTSPVQRIAVASKGGSRNKDELQSQDNMSEDDYNSESSDRKYFWRDLLERKESEKMRLEQGKLPNGALSPSSTSPSDPLNESNDSVSSIDKKYNSDEFGDVTGNDATTTTTTVAATNTERKNDLSKDQQSLNTRDSLGNYSDNSLLYKSINDVVVINGSRRSSGLFDSSNNNSTEIGVTTLAGGDDDKDSTRHSRSGSISNPLTSWERYLATKQQQPTAASMVSETGTNSDQSSRRNSENLTLSFGLSKIPFQESDYDNLFTDFNFDKNNDTDASRRYLTARDMSRTVSLPELYDSKSSIMLLPPTSLHSKEKIITELKVEETTAPSTTSTIINESPVVTADNISTLTNTDKLTAKKEITPKDILTQPKPLTTILDSEPVTPTTLQPILLPLLAGKGTISPENRRKRISLLEISIQSVLATENTNNNSSSNKHNKGTLKKGVKKVKKSSNNTDYNWLSLFSEVTSTTTTSETALDDDDGEYENTSNTNGEESNDEYEMFRDSDIEYNDNSKDNDNNNNNNIDNENNMQSEVSGASGSNGDGTSPGDSNDCNKVTMVVDNIQVNKSEAGGVVLTDSDMGKYTRHVTFAELPEVISPDLPPNISRDNSDNEIDNSNDSQLLLGPLGFEKCLNKKDYEEFLGIIKELSDNGFEIETLLQLVVFLLKKGFVMQAVAVLCQSSLLLEEGKLPGVHQGIISRADKGTLQLTTAKLLTYCIGDCSSLQHLKDSFLLSEASAHPPVSILLLAASVKFVLGEYDDAEKHVWDAVRRNPTCLEGWQAIAMIAALRGNFKEASSAIHKLLQQSISLGPEKETTRFVDAVRVELAWLQEYFNQDISAIINAYSSIFPLGSKGLHSSICQTGLGQLKHKAGDLKGALEKYNRAIRADDSNCIPLLLRAIVNTSIMVTVAVNGSNRVLKDSNNKSELRDADVDSDYRKGLLLLGNRDYKWAALLAYAAFCSSFNRSGSSDSIDISVTGGDCKRTEEVLWSAVECGLRSRTVGGIWSMIALAHFYQYTRGRLDLATNVLGWCRKYFEGEGDPKFSEFYRETSAIIIAQAYVNLETGHRNTAVMLAGEALSRCPGLVAAERLLAIEKWFNRKYDEALKSMAILCNISTIRTTVPSGDSKGLTSIPSTVATGISYSNQYNLQIYGAMQAITGQYRSALSTLLLAHSISLCNPHVLRLIGVLTYILGSNNSLDTTSNFAPEGVNPTVTINTKRCHNALSYIEACLKISPDDVDALQLKGQLLMEVGNFSTARMTLKKALMISPSNTVLLSSLALCVTAIKKKILAGISSNPTAKLDNVSKSVLKELENSSDLFEDAMMFGEEKGEESLPSDVIYWYGLSCLQTEDGTTGSKSNFLSAMAKALLQRAAQRQDALPHPMAIFMLGWLEECDGDFTAAEQCYCMALQAHPMTSLTKLRLAQMVRDTGGFVRGMYLSAITSSETAKRMKNKSQKKKKKKLSTKPKSKNNDAEVKKLKSMGNIHSNARNITISKQLNDRNPATTNNSTVLENVPLLSPITDSNGSFFPSSPASANRKNKLGRAQSSFASSSLSLSLIKEENSLATMSKSQANNIPFSIPHNNNNNNDNGYTEYEDKNNYNHHEKVNDTSNYNTLSTLRYRADLHERVGKMLLRIDFQAEETEGLMAPGKFVYIDPFWLEKYLHVFTECDDWAWLARSCSLEKS